MEPDPESGVDARGRFPLRQMGLDCKPGSAGTGYPRPSQNVRHSRQLALPVLWLAVFV